MQKIFFLLFVLCLFPISILHASSASVTEVGHFMTDGSTKDVVISGDYAYIADLDAGLIIMDISDPSNAVEVGSIDLTWAKSLAVSGNYAYVLAAQWSPRAYYMKVIDITDPTAPAVLGSYEVSENANYVNASGAYVYVSDYENGLRIINVSDPTSPTLVSTYDTVQPCGNVAIVGNYLYFSDGYEFTLLDVSNPSSPAYINKIVIQSSVFYYAGMNKIIIDGDYAYASHYFGFSIIDISDPLNLSIINRTDTDRNTNSITLSGDYLYLANDNGISVYEITNPSSVNEVSVDNLILSHSTKDIEIAGNYAFSARSGMGFSIFNIADPENILLVKDYYFSGQTWGMYVEGDRAYVPDMQSGLQIYDLSDPADPEKIGSYNSLYNTNTSVIQIAGQCLDVKDTYALFNMGTYDPAPYNGSGVIELVDVSDPANIEFKSHIVTDSNPAHAYIEDNYAYISDRSNLYIYDISNPASPVELSRSAYAGGIAVFDNYLFISGASTDLSVFNISDPSNPILLGTYEDNQINSIYNVELLGNYLYLLTEYNNVASLKILDFVDPSALTQVGNYDFAKEVSSMSAFANKVYVLGNYAEDPAFHVIDVSNPVSPMMILTEDVTDTEMNNIDIMSNGYIYLGGQGVTIYSADLNGDEDIDNHSELKNVNGLKKGKARLNYGNSDKSVFQIFTTDSKNKTKVKQYKHTDYFVAVHPEGVRIAMVNGITGEATSNKLLSKNIIYNSNSIRFSTVRKNHAILVISKNASGQVLASLVKVIANYKLRIRGQVNLTNADIKISKAEIKKNKLLIKDKRNNLVISYKINKKLKLK